MNLANLSLSIIDLAPLSKREIVVLCWTLNTTNVSVAFPGEHLVALAHMKLRKLRKLLRKGILLALV